MTCIVNDLIRHKTKQPTNQLDRPSNFDTTVHGQSTICMATCAKEWNTNTLTFSAVQKDIKKSKSQIPTP